MDEISKMCGIDGLKVAQNRVEWNRVGEAAVDGEWQLTMMTIDKLFSKNIKANKSRRRDGVPRISNNFDSDFDPTALKNTVCIGMYMSEC